MAEPKKGGDANAFIREYSPIAEKVGKELNVDPRILLAQWGNEVGWGASIQGSHNLGNIKSASGKGKVATDNQTKSVDAYLNFEDPDVFADYYAGYLKRRFPGVVGAGSDVNAFTSALRPGQQGGYAEDKDYGSKLSNAFSLVNARMESQKGDDYDKTFGVGTPTAAQTMGEETTTTSGGGNEEQSGMSKEDAALYGAGAGFLAGKVAQGTKIPTSARFEQATERLNMARDRLAEVQSRAAKTGNVADLEAEFKRAQGAYQAAELELATATDELKAARASRTAPVAAAPEAGGLTPTADQQARGIQGTTKDTGITGRASQTTYNERTSQIARNERAQRAALGQLGQQGIIDPNKAYALTEGISASTPSGVLVPPGEAAIRQAQLEAELAPLEQRTQQARATRQTAGDARRTASQAVTQARRGQQAVESAQGAVNVAEKALERAPSGPQGVLGKTGAMTAKAAPKVLGVVSGAATGMAAMEAIERFKAGDYSGAVLPTLEATFGVMSMLPPAHPVLLALRGLGTLGGGALLGYEAYKYGTREKPQSAEYQAP